MSKRDRSQSLFDPAILKPALLGSFTQARPARAGEESGDVHRRDGGRWPPPVLHGARPRDRRQRAAASRSSSSIWLWVTVLFATFAEAVAEGRGKAQADTLRRMRGGTMAKVLLGVERHVRAPPRSSAARSARRCWSRAGDLVPGDGEIIEVVATIGEIGHHQARSAPVIREARRRPLGRHRRHARAVGPDRRSASPPKRIELPRPHDRPGRRAPRARRRPTSWRSASCWPGFTLIFVLARRHHPRASHLCRRRGLRRRADRPVRHPDPDDHRCAAVGHRHRRHEPAGTLQRAGDLRPCRRGGRRRRHAAARQDRHHHPGQPPRHAVHPGDGRDRGRGRARWPSSPAWRTRRRKAVRSSCWPRRSMACAASAWPSSHAQFVPFTAQTRMSGVDHRGRGHPQGRHRFGDRAAAATRSASRRRSRR